VEGCFPGIIWDQKEYDAVQEGDNSRNEEDGDDVNIGYKVVEMEVQTFENEHSILKCYPVGDIKPQPFEQGICAYDLQV